MTRLLISVRSAEEADIALAAGVDLIDIKEPSQGALGAASAEQVTGILDLIGGQAPVSVALGELVDRLAQGGQISHQHSLAGSVIARCQFAKLGLAGCAGLPDWPGRWAAALQPLPPQVAAVAVAYADWQACAAPDPWQVLRQGALLRCKALLVDTFDKSAGSLPQLWPAASLAEFIDAAWSLHLLVVLGGSLSLTSLPWALSLQPDYIAVRGAVCEGGRTGSISAALVQAFRTQLAPPRTVPPQKRDPLL